MLSVTSVDAIHWYTPVVFPDFNHAVMDVTVSEQYSVNNL